MNAQKYYQTRMSNKEFISLFDDANLTVKEGVTVKLNEKALFISSHLKEREEVSLKTLNSWFTNSKDINQKGYFRLSDVISIEDLARVQKATLRACALNEQDLKILDSQGNRCFLEVHRDKKTGELSVARVPFSEARTQKIKYVTKEAQEKALEKKEREQLAKLLKKYGN